MQFSAFLVAGVGLLLAACSGGEPDISVGNAWARETVAGQGHAAVYLDISNRGAGNDRLLEAKTPRASKAMLHGTSNEGGIHRMRELDGVEIAAGSTVDLAPGGQHIMLTGVSEPLRAGMRFALTLRFERSGERQVDVAVRKATETVSMEHQH